MVTINLLDQEALRNVNIYDIVEIVPHEHGDIYNIKVITNDNKSGLYCCYGNRPDVCYSRDQCNEYIDDIMLGVTAYVKAIDDSNIRDNINEGLKKDALTKEEKQSLLRLANKVNNEVLRTNLKEKVYNKGEL